MGSVMRTEETIGLVLIAAWAYVQWQQGGLGGNRVTLPGQSPIWTPQQVPPSSLAPPGAPGAPSMTDVLVTAGVGSGVAIATALFGGPAGSGAGAGAGAAGAAAGISTSAVLAASGIAAAGAILVWGITSRGWFRGGEESLFVNKPRDEFKTLFAHFNPYQEGLTDRNGPGFFGLAHLLHEVAGARGDSMMTAFNRADSRREWEAIVRDIESLIVGNQERVAQVRDHALRNFTWNR